MAQEAFDLKAVIERAAASVRPQVEARELVLLVEVGPNLGRVTGDARRTEQILLNLLWNPR